MTLNILASIFQNVKSVHMNPTICANTRVLPSCIYLLLLFSWTRDKRAVFDAPAIRHVCEIIHVVLKALVSKELTHVCVIFTHVRSSDVLRSASTTTFTITSASCIILNKEVCAPGPCCFKNWDVIYITTDKAQVNKNTLKPFLTPFSL